MTLERRAARIVADLPAMQRLAARFAVSSTHATDLPYRLTIDGAADDLAGVVWEDRAGSMVGWAIWIPGHWGMECAADPAHAIALHPQMIAWGDEQAAAFARGRAEPTPRWWLYARSDDHARIAALESHGFERKDWRYVHFERELADELATPSLPGGFALRQLDGESDVPGYVAAHRAAFNSTFMNDGRRLRMLKGPAYRPDLDLVVTDPDGRVVAFAILWLGPDGEGQFEPVGTIPEFQRRGLARALLLEGMRRLRAAGAKRAVVNTDTGREGAQAFYESLMQRAAHTTLPFTKALVP